MVEEAPAKPSEEELRQRLTPLQFHVTQEGGTEHGGSGRFYKHDERGTYVCVVCGADLFSSGTKFASGSGWPSYWAPVSGEAVRLVEDRGHGMVRTEVRCAQCDAHLGHLFDDGPRDTTGQRYCINSASLDFEAK